MTFNHSLFRIFSKIQRRLSRYSTLLIAVTILSVISLTVWLVYNLIYQSNFTHQLLPTLQKSLLSFWDPTSALVQTNNRTNLLILGRGGTGHTAPDLTDSLILISINHQTKHLFLLPLPRDIWIPSLRAKLNTAYSYGEQLSPGSGLTLIKSAVSEVINLPIHYALLIDFTGFEKTINLLGGIDLVVNTSFDDYRYPIPGQENAEPESNRYQHVHFNAGLQHLDGPTALKYVRSRNADGPEGTDLARSERQKQVLLAIKNKLLSTQVIFNRTKFLQIKNILGESLITDIHNDLYPAFARLALDFRAENLNSSTLPVYLETRNGNTASASALLINPPISPQHDYQWVLVPTTDSFTQIHTYINCLLNANTNCLTN